MTEFLNVPNLHTVLHSMWEALDLPSFVPA